MRLKRCCKSVLEIPKPGPRTGQTFSGKIHGPALEPRNGRYHVRIQLIERFILRRTGDRQAREMDHVRWEDAVSLDANLHSLADGLPFSFALPPQSELRREVNEATRSFARGAIHLSIPGCAAGR